MKNDYISFLNKIELNIDNYKIKIIDIKEDYDKIEKFNKDLEEIKNYDNKLKEFLSNIKNFKKISISKNKKYKGELYKGKPEGRGILYNEYNDIHYIGYFIRGKNEGYGSDYYYKGFFIDGKYNGFGINRTYNYTDKIIYIGYFKNGNYNSYRKKIKNNKLFYQGKGSIYYENENIYINGEFNNNILINGKLYNPNGKLIYNGNFINKNSKKGKI